MLDEIDGDDFGFLRRTARPRPRKTSAVVRLVDLFSGAGGLTLGAAEACRSLGRELEVRLAMELAPNVRGVYDVNFHSAVASDRADVRTRFDHCVGARLSAAERLTRSEVGVVDVLVGGPPCQGHSDLNNFTRRRDEKNELYLVMVRAAELLEPTVLLIENVQGVRRDHHRVVERAIHRLEHLGYEVRDALVRMVDIGVPQKRVRHILIASKVKGLVEGTLDFPSLPKPRTLRWAIGDLQDIESRTAFDSAGRLSPENQARARLLLAKRLYNLPNEYRPRCHRDNPSHRYRAMYGRLRWDEPAHTITTGFGSPGQGRYLHPERVRTLTPHEAARIQFYPDWFDFGANSNRGLLAHCIGNAVPPKLSFAVLLRLLRGQMGAGGTDLGPPLHNPRLGGGTGRREQAA